MRFCRADFADDVRHQTGMVITGKSSTNKVDEEVHVRPGDEAKGCFDGDRRAIADVDQAGSLDDISGETKTLRAVRALEPPTDATRMLHNTTMHNSAIGVQFASQADQEVRRIYG